MQTISQPRAPAPAAAPWPALTAAMDNDSRPAQIRALQRWHQRDALCVLDQAIARHGHYPLIAGNDQPRAFAPRRGTPRPAA